MKNDYCHVTFVLDSSGSMRGCWDETILSIKKFTDDQRKEDGKLTFSLYCFNGKIRKFLDFVDIKNESQYFDCNNILDLIQPDGWTALWEAAKHTINETGSRLASLPEWERPAKVLMVYLTDGKDNQSGYGAATQVRQMITHQKDKYNWQFAFLGADFDVKEDATAAGVQYKNFSKFDMLNAVGTEFSKSVSKYRGMSADSYNVNVTN